MDRRRAGALLALAACIATTAAAPTASNQTALDLYEGASEGCYYNFQHYGEGDRIMTNEPCLNCTCHNRMLMCYLRVCPFTKPIGQDCSVEKRADQCCPIVTCPDVPVDLLTSTSTSSPAEYGETGLGKLDRYGCSINGKYFPEGSKVPPTPNKPCEHCYCIRNMTTCVMQECTLHVDGCTPIYRKDVCCPVRYLCDHPEDEIPLLDDMTTTVRPTPGFLLTTTTVSPVTQITQDCVHDDKIFPDGALIRTEKACEHCYCMKGDIVCVVQECGTPMENEGKNCTSMPPREGQCCPDTYICEGDEVTTEPKLDIATVTSLEDITTMSPPRRVSVEGSGYRSETDEPFTEAPTFEPDTEGSGEEQSSYKPTDKNDMLIPENEPSPSITTEKDEIVDQDIPSATVVPIIETEMTDKATTEPDKGENTVPSDSLEEVEKIDTSEQETTPGSETTSSKMETVTELATKEETTALPKDESHAEDDITPQEEETTALPKDESHAKDDITPQEETTALPKDESHAKDDITQQEETTALPKDESHAKDDITPQEETTTLPKDESAKDDITSQEETTALPKDESHTKDDVTLQEQTAATEPTSIADTTIGDHKVHTSLDGMESTERESFETTVPTRRKEDQEKPSIETTTVKDIEDFTTKPSDLTGLNTLTTESTTSFVEQEAQTSPSHIPEKDNEVLIQEPTTESNLELITKSDVVKSETDSITTLQPEVAAEVTTSAKVDIIETTSANPIENEIDEESFPTPVPGRIPGEGDCLLDGVTYSHESIVPSSNNCHTSCRCISSIVKCEPVICSPPPDYMDNCQPMYDTPESCCPTYVCDHPRETVPPQSHSQMAGTETTPTIECDGDQCEVVKDKEPVKPAVACNSEGCADESSKKPDDCGPQGCSEAENKQKEPHPSKPEGCVGNSCSSTPEQCNNGQCDAAIPKDQTCNSENGCEIPVIQTCEGDNCSVQPVDSAIKDSSSKPAHCEGESCVSELPSQMADTEILVPTPTIDCDGDQCEVVKDKEPVKPAATCNSEGCVDESSKKPDDCGPQGCSEAENKQKEPHPSEPEECIGNSCSSTPEQCSNGKCDAVIPKDQTCNSEYGCEIPVIQTCEGDNCSVQPDDSAIKDSSSKPPHCEGESCVSELPSQSIPKEKDSCKDSDNCGQPDQTVVEECKEEGCRRQQAPDINKPASSDCTSTECTPQDPQIIDVPEINTESIPSITELSESTETKHKEPVTDLPKTTAFEKEIGPSKATEASIPEQEEEILHTTEIPIISDIGTEVDKQTEVPEPGTSSINEEPITNPPQDAIKDENAVDITTAEPALPAVDNVSPEISQETTESQEMLTLAPESLDRDGHEEPTKEPEYVQDTESKVTEPAEDYTTTPDKLTTSKSEAEPIDEQESHGAPTTPKSYDSQNTNEPEILDTNISTTSPETQSTSQQELEPEPSENTARPDEHVTSKLDAIQTTVSTLSSGSEEGIQTKTTVLDESEITPKPEVSLDEHDQVTEAPQLITSSDEELTTNAVHDLVSDFESQTESSEPPTTLAPGTGPQESDILTTEDKHIETPAPVTVQVQTETPMSIVKGHDEEEINITRAPESEIITEQNELITRKPESPESEIPSDKFDSEKMSTVSAEKPTTATTRTSISDLETTISPTVEEKLSTDAPVHDSKVTVVLETETSTDNILSSAPVSAEYPEIFATEREEKTTESAPITPSEDIVSRVTESSVQSTAEDGYVITTAQGQVDEDIDSTELPELTIHEHPTEPSSIGQELDQSVTNDVTSKGPEMAVTEPQTISEKDTTGAPISQDVTKSPAEPQKQPEKEVSVVPEQEKVTLSPEMFGTETTVSKTEDATSYIPEISATESQSEATTSPEAEISPTHAPETVATPKEEAEIPVTEDNVTSGPKISETEPQEIVTESVEAQSPDTVTNDPHKYMTDAPESHDIVTSDSITAEPEKESTSVTEVSEIEPHKEITNIPETQDVTTVASIISESATQSPDISPTESHAKGTEEPDSQDEETSAPSISEAGSQETATKAQSQEVVTTIPETPDTVPEKDLTEAPVPHDIITSIPEVSVTESSPVEDTFVPVVQEVSTVVPDLSESEPQKETTEGLAHEDTSNVPPVYATEYQKDVTKAPIAEDKVTNVPDLAITESQTTKSQASESQDMTTDATVPAQTEPKKETTEIPELEEAAVTSPEISQTEPKKEITEEPETLITDAPDITQSELLEPTTVKPESQDADSKGPETSATAYEKEVTNAPEVQDMATQILDVAPTESQQETTEAQETPEKTITESQTLATESPESPDTATNLPEILATDSQPKTTEPSISPALVTNAPEIKVETEPNKETPEQELATSTTESAQSTYKPEPEEQAVTERDESFTGPPLKITTKLDANAQKEPQEFVTPTESSINEADTSLPTVDGSLVEQSSTAPESLATETSDKVADLDTATDEPAEDMVTGGENPEQKLEIATEKPSEEPIKIPELIEPEKTDLTTESSVPPESYESDTKLPELSVTESDVTSASPMTHKQDYTTAPETVPTDSRRTEATSAPVEEELQTTKTPEILESQDKTTKTSETPEEISASKDEYPETTPYLVLLEEHTHKKDIYTVSPDEEITTSPSDVSQKDDEPLAPEDSIGKVTESAPSKESEKPIEEDEISNKDVPEITLTTVSEKITEPSPVSEEITTIAPLPESFDTEKPQNVESNEISTSIPILDEEPVETEKPSVPSIGVETEKDVLATEKPHETTAPEEEFILASTKATTLKVEEEPTTISPLEDKFGKPEEAPKPDSEAEKPKPETAEEIPKPGANDVQPTEEAIQPDDESHFPPSGTSGYGQEPDYGEEDSFGPGTCRYGGKVYVSAQQIPRDDPCDFCFCFRSDIICLQQSCPPPIHGCHEEPIQGFCCPRYECPVSMATTLNVTTTTTTTTTTLPPHFLPHAYKGAAQRRGCQIKGHTYKVGEVVRASSGPCLHCTCGGDGQMKCDPKVCTPEPMLRQMIAAAVSAKRRR